MMTDSKSGDTGRMPLLQRLFVGSGTETDRRNNLRFTIWSIVWAAALITATWIVNFFENLPTTAAWAIALSPNVFAIGALIAYLRFLRMTDELQRKIQIEGLAIGFGTGWIFAIGYLVLQAVGAPELPVTAMIIVMTGGWILGTLLATRHYQ